MTPLADSASTTILAQIANSALRALVLSGVAALGLAAFRVKATAVRLFTWTAVLYAALAMPLLQRLLPTLPVPTPAALQFATESASPAQPISPANNRGTLAHEDNAQTSTVIINQRQREATERRAATTAEPSLKMPSPSVDSAFVSPPPSGPFSVGWSKIAAAIYFAGVLLFVLRFTVGLAFGRKLQRASHLIPDPRIKLRLASFARASGLSSVPRAAESELISVPLTMGVLHATILLPAGWREWDDAKLDAVVAHEVSHVARRDALTQRLSLLHRAIFWFSPLAWWLDRRLADLAEQASDEAALICGADRKDYARTLLEFFEALQAAPGRVWWQGVAMAKAGQAEKRLERILGWKGSVAMRLKRSIAVVVLTLAIPVVYFAASVHAANKTADASGAYSAQDQTPPPAHPAPSAQPAPAPAPSSDATPPPTILAIERQQVFECRLGVSDHGIEHRPSQIYAGASPPRRDEGCSRVARQRSRRRRQLNLQLELGEAFRNRFIKKLLHLPGRFFRQFALLAAEFTLLFAELALLFSQRAHFFSELALLVSGMRLDIANLALQFPNLRLNLPDLLHGGAGTELLQFSFELVEFRCHVRNGHMNLFHLFAERFLLFSQSFLLLAQFFLFLAEFLLRSPQFAGAIDGRLVANDVRLLVALEPDEVAGNRLSQFLDMAGIFGRA